MDNISRRQFIIRSILFGAGTISGGLSLLSLCSRQRSYFIITDKPASDLRRLLYITKIANNKANIEYASIRPSFPDLGIVENGRLIDPIQSHGLDPDLQNFAHELRSRKRVGMHLVKVDAPGLDGNDTVVFQVNGEIVEQVSLQNNYQKIILVGEEGKTSFKLQNSFLSVTQAPCRYKVCREMGPINCGKIICAPNKLVATINPTYRLVDGITG